mgnify:CR=1 FL=1
MILHYFKKKENKDKINAEFIYNNIIDYVKILVNEKNLYIKKDLNSSFEITSFLLCSLFYGVKVNSNGNNKKITQELMRLFINDLDHSFRISGVSDMKIGKTVKLYVKKFYYRVKKLEVIFEEKKIDQYEDYIENLDIFYENDSKKKLILMLYNNSKILIDGIKNDEIIKTNLFNSNN